MTEMLRFPKAPHYMGTYWDVNGTGTPNMSFRWQVFECNKQRLEVFFRGTCLNCGRSCWTCADGTILRAMEYNGMLEVRDPDTGAVYRGCYNCGLQANRSQIIVDRAREMLAAGEDPAPIPLPKHRTVAA